MYFIQALFLSVAVFLCEGKLKHLQKGEVAYHVKKISADQTQFEVTDGSFYLLATTSRTADDVIRCRLYSNDKKPTKLMKKHRVRYEVIGEEQIRRMQQKCRKLHTKSRRSSLDDDNKFNHNIVKGKPFGGDFSTGQPSGAGTHFAIYPGTKWCGFQNVADNMQDLGVHNATDACCRTHDHCPYYIDRFESKYHYYNAYPWTISHCDCDQHLFDCLRSVHTQTSNAVGQMFFGLLDVQCFTFEQGEYCVNSSSVLSKLWCGKKTAGQMAVMQKFPHKWGESDEDPSIIGK